MHGHVHRNRYNISQWDSCQICNIVGCACAGNAGNGSELAAGQSLLMQSFSNSSTHVQNKSGIFMLKVCMQFSTWHA